MQRVEIAAVDNAPLEHMNVSHGTYLLLVDANLAPDVKVWNQEVMVLGRGSGPHVLLQFGLALRSQSGGCLGHGKEKVVAFRREEDVQTMQSHREGDVTEDPLQERRIREVMRRGNPVFGPNDLSQRLDFASNGRHNLSRCACVRQSKKIKLAGGH